ncbi:MAG: response regulator transcription factor [Chitinophagaceae bacterium]|nr:MAG: response regulator transcription factor [Chitinophagaceae bacterium]
MEQLTYISVVDDHLPFRKGLIVLINLFAGYKVLFDAANGRELVEKIERGQLPDIVLLDIIMPEMDGFQTARWLQKFYPDIKILAVSTMDSEAAILQMLECGAKGYLLKGADGDELKTAFEKLKRGELYFSDAIEKKRKTG